MSEKNQETDPIVAGHPLNGLLVVPRPGHSFDEDFVAYQERVEAIVGRTSSPETGACKNEDNE